MGLLRLILFLRFRVKPTPGVQQIFQVCAEFLARGAQIFSRSDARPGVRLPRLSSRVQPDQHECLCAT